MKNMVSLGSGAFGKQEKDGFGFHLSENKQIGGRLVIITIVSARGAIHGTISGNEDSGVCCTL